MAQPVIGIDFGNESCYVAVAKAGGIEVLTNDYSLRDTPSCVAFHTRNRLIGVSAKSQQVTNISNSITSFKRLLGLNLNEPCVEHEVRHLPFTIVPTQEGGVGVKVQLQGEERVFSAEQITAMLFTKLKDISEVWLSCKVSDCVITIPVYFTDRQRRAVLDSAAMAGLNVLRLLNETTATALTYGLYKSDLPAPEAKPKHVAFVDFGQAQLQVAIVAFNKGKLKVISVAYDAELGGRDFDRLLVIHVLEQWQTRYKLNLRADHIKDGTTAQRRAVLRLLTEVDKLKRQMSANATSLPLSIECFYDEKDVTIAMKRLEMEEMCGYLFDRLEATLKRSLHEAGLTAADIDEVEVVGGSTRIPAVKARIEKAYGKPPMTTLNQDEAVARGAAIMAAMLSPAFKVREFSVTDATPFSIRLAWSPDMGEEGEMEVFSKFHAFPFSKMLTFMRKDPFKLTAYYGGDVFTNDKFIGEFLIHGVKPSAQGEPQKVKVKARLNPNGIFQLSSAALMEKVPATKEHIVPMEIEGQPSPQQQVQPVAAEEKEETKSQDEAKMETEQTQDMDVNPSATAGKKPGDKFKAIELEIDSHTGSLSKNVVDSLIEQEAQLRSADRAEQMRIDSKNSLEELVLDSRNRFSDPDDLAPFLEEQERVKVAKFCDETENWLYEDGEDCPRQEYTQRLEQIKGLTDTARIRHKEFLDRPHALERLAVNLQRARKTLDSHRRGDESYDHLNSEDAANLDKAISEKQAWLDKHAALAHSTPRHFDNPVKTSAIEQEIRAFESGTNPIINKAKPKPPPAPSAGAANDSTGAEKGQAPNASSQPQSQDGMETE